MSAVLYSLFLLTFALVPLVAESAASPGSHVITRRQSQDDPCSVQNYVVQNPGVSQECVMRLNATLQSRSFADTLAQGFCDPVCSPPYLGFLRDCFNQQPAVGLPPGTMIGSLLVEYYILFCGISDINNMSCYSLLSTDEDNTVDDLAGIPLDGPCAPALTNPSTCTSQCTEQVTSARTQIGCCINNFLNTSYFRIADSNSTRLVSYAFWDGCDVETPSYCPVNSAFYPYLSPEIASILNLETTTTSTVTTPTTPPDQGDPCSLESYFLQNPDVSQECVMQLDSAFQSSSFADILAQGFCDPVCSPPYLGFLRDCFNQQPDDPGLPPGTMIGSLLVEYYILFCGVSDTNDMPCYSFLSTDEDNTAEDLAGIPLDGPCAPALTNPSTCTSQCTEQVKSARTRIGCCINNFLNTSYGRIAGPAITRLVSYAFWDGCDVDTPSYCPVNSAFYPYLSPEIASILDPNFEATTTSEPGDTATRMTAFNKLLYVLIIVGVIMLMSAM